VFTKSFSSHGQSQVHRDFISSLTSSYTYCSWEKHAMTQLWWQISILEHMSSSTHYPTLKYKYKSSTTSHYITAYYYPLFIIIV